MSIVVVVFGSDHGTLEILHDIALFFITVTPSFCMVIVIFLYLCRLHQHCISKDHFRKILTAAGKIVAPGVTTEEIDALVSLLNLGIGC